MKSTIKVLLAIYCVIGVCYSFFGGVYFYRFVEMGKEYPVFDKIMGVEAAFYGEKNSLNICLFGELAETQSNETFRYRLYLANVKLQSEFPSVEVLDRSDVSKGCDGADNVERLEVTKMTLTYASAYTAYDIIKPINTNESTGVIDIAVIDSYTNERRASNDIAIIHGSSVIFVSADSYMYDGSNLWFFAAPIGIVFDVLSYPYQIYQWIAYLKK